MRGLTGVCGLSLALLAGATATATPAINVGTLYLLPNSQKQIALTVSGGDPVEGMDLYIQIGDGGTPNGGSDTAPVVTALDIIGPGTLFHANNTGSQPMSAGGLLWMDSTTTAMAAVAANGTLAFVTIDTTGTLDGQSYGLRLAGVAAGIFGGQGVNTDFALVPANITNGQIVIRALHPMVWSGAADGNWANNTWTGQPPAFPNYTADAVVDTPWTVTVDQAREANSLALSNGGKVSVTAAGSLSLTTSPTIAATATLEVAGTLAAAGPTLNNDGIFNLTGGNAAGLHNIDGAGNTSVTGGSVVFIDRVRQNQLTVSANGLVSIRATQVANDPGSTSRLNSLSMVGPTLQIGTLDLNNNSLVIDYAGPVGAALSDVTAAIQSGRNGKDNNDQANWNGKGIITTAGRAANTVATIDRYNLGAINNADLSAAHIGSPYTTFAGQAVTPQTVLVKYTYSGDADLNGVVDGDDYTYWLNGFLDTTPASVQGWLRGDFDYNGVIDGDDYTQWLNTFLAAGPPIGAAPAPVPEPGTACLLVFAAGVMLFRGRRSR